MCLFVYVCVYIYLYIRVAMLVVGVRECDLYALVYNAAKILHIAFASHYPVVAIHSTFITILLAFVGEKLGIFVFYKTQ